MLNDKPTIVFDVDDTISTNFKRLSYDKCVPVTDVINKLNYLHDVLGYRIVLYTARGMVSCNGDIAKIIQKNKAILEKWLEQNNVHYDELRFGKPLGDMYVDDKAMNVDTFLKSEFCEVIGGGSGSKITRLGYLIKKDLKTEAECTMFKNWVDDNKHMCLYPKVVSYLYNYVYMYYVKGETLANQKITFGDLNAVCKTIERFGQESFNVFNLQHHIDSLMKNYGFDSDFDKIILYVFNELKANESEIKKYASYCHGDCILSNIVKENGQAYYFIDPRYERTSSTYLLDFAKLRMSLQGYEYIFGISEIKQDENIVEHLDWYLKDKQIFKYVVLFQLMHICRLYRYKNEFEKPVVKQMALEVKKEYEELLNS